MAGISVSQKTFETIANAAMTAYLNNEFDEAEELDKIARRINAALSNQSIINPWGIKSTNLKWNDVPSVLEKLKENDNNANDNKG